MEPPKDPGLISGVNEEFEICFRCFDSPETKKRFLTCLRTSIGIASFYYSPMAALAGAGVALVSPSLAERGMQTIDGAVTGLWEKMSIIARVGSTAGGIFLLWAEVNPIPLAVTTSFFAVKLGTEIAIMNYNR